MRLIGISGGIGSGKSLVSRVLLSMGYPVYDCDSRAKALMTASDELRASLSALFGEEVYLPDGSLNKEYLSAKVFSDDAGRAAVNSVVHPAVRRDIARWAEECERDGCEYAFVESAILYESHLHEAMDEVVYVDAPADVRVRRAMARDGAAEEAVARRMQAQRPSEEDNRRVASYIIYNDGRQSLVAQVAAMAAALAG